MSFFLIDKEDHEWMEDVGKIFLESGHRDAAARAFSLAVKGSPKDADLWVSLSNIYMEYTSNQANNPKNKSAGQQ